MSIIETTGLGRRYGATWALRDCDLEVPSGHLVALVGPNGAGKSTLLNLVVGLTAPSAGTVTVLDGRPAGSPGALDGIGFVAQDMPLYRNVSVRDMVHLTRNLNRHVDVAYARRRLGDLGIPDRQRCGKLSGGQQAQLALTLALARHPRLLVLDEPTAPLDPLARHDFMAAVMEAMADEGLSVVLSSHLLAELERVADYLILITHGRVVLDGTVESLLGTHRLVTGPADAVPGDGWEVVETSTTSVQSQRLVRLRPGDLVPADCESRQVGVEELALAYLRDSSVPAPALVGSAR